MRLSELALVDPIAARRFKASDLDLDIMPGPSQQQDDAYTYESQNDQRLDELHSKLRSLRGVRPSSSSTSLCTCAHSRAGNNRHL